MDKFSELKRLAEKCPVQRFEPFIGLSVAQEVEEHRRYSMPIPRAKL